MLSSLRALTWRVVRCYWFPHKFRNESNVLNTALNNSRSTPGFVSGVKPVSETVGGGQHVASSTAQLRPNLLAGLLGRLRPLLFGSVRRLAQSRQQSYRYRDSAPLFALVGVTLLSSNEFDDESPEDVARKYRGFVTKEEELEAFCCSIREASSKTAWVHDSISFPSNHNGEHVFSLKDLEIGSLLGQGCNAAVYAARWHKEEEESTTNVELSTAETLAANTSTKTSEDDKENISIQTNDYSYNFDILSTFETLSKYHESDGIGCNFWARYCSNPDLTKSSLITPPPSHNSVLNLSSLGAIERENLSIIQQEPVGATDGDARFSTNIGNRGNQSSLSALVSSGNFGNVKNIRKVRFVIPQREDENTDAEVSSNVTAASNKSNNIGPHDSPITDFPLAIKFVFNYEAASNAPAILRALYKELLPARSLQLDDLYTQWRNSFFGEDSHVLLPFHPNVVDMPCAFVDRVPNLKGGLDHYPFALPSRINPEGLGRNMSLFCVMKRYELPLDHYLIQYPNLQRRTSLLLLTQLLEALQHLAAHHISHRDLKPDNLLVSLVDGWQNPWLVLTDFGCCLAAGSARGLMVSFSSREGDPRQGNTALMAPEVKCAQPGFMRSIDFSRCDLWAAGTLAYQFYGADNPFLKIVEKDCLDSGTYKESQLPGLTRNDAPAAIRRLVYDLLRRNPSQRPDATTAATLCQLALWAPSQWLNRHSLMKPKHKQVMEWLLSLTTKVICDQRREGAAVTEHRLVTTFLSRVHFSHVMKAIDWNRAF